MTLTMWVRFSCSEPRPMSNVWWNCSCERFRQRLRMSRVPQASCARRMSCTSAVRGRAGLTWTADEVVVVVVILASLRRCEPDQVQQGASRVATATALANS
jgi:hypothetical protein